MATGLSLALSPEQASMRNGLHAVARDEIRAQSTQIERDGVDVKLLFGLLEDTGISPCRRPSNLTVWRSIMSAIMHRRNRFRPKHGGLR